MGIFSRKPKFALPPQDAGARDYALGQHAPGLIAESFAEDVAAGAFGDLAGGYSAAWWAWCAQNVAVCPACESPWALLIPCVSAWECDECTFSWDAEAA